MTDPDVDAKNAARRIRDLEQLLTEAGAAADAANRRASVAEASMHAAWEAFARAAGWRVQDCPRLSPQW